MLKIGQYPLPYNLVEKIYNECDELLILEEGYPVIEERIKGFLNRVKNIKGRIDGTLPFEGELNPVLVAKALGFKPEQIEAGLLVPWIGNTYAGSALVGLTAVLDTAQPEDRILLVSYGSGAGSDVFSLRTTEHLIKRRLEAPYTQEYVERRTEVDYATYSRYRGKLMMK